MDELGIHRDADDHADERLAEAHRRFRSGESDIEVLARAEREHLAARPSLGARHRPSRGDLCIDRDGDAWRFGTRLWTCQSNVDTARILRVARMTHEDLAREYGPVRRIGRRDTWDYVTIRGRP